MRIQVAPHLLSTHPTYRRSTQLSLCIFTVLSPRLPAQTRNAKIVLSIFDSRTFSG